MEPRELWLVHNETRQITAFLSHTFSSFTLAFHPRGTRGGLWNWERGLHVSGEIEKSHRLQTGGGKSLNLPWIWKIFLLTRIIPKTEMRLLNVTVSDQQWTVAFYYLRIFRKLTNLPLVLLKEQETIRFSMGQSERALREKNKVVLWLYCVHSSCSMYH